MRVLLLSEDKSSQTHRALRALLQKMFRQVDPSAQSQKIEIRPVEEQRVLLIMRANQWRNEKGVSAERDRRAMIGTLAETLLKGQFVAVHFDGDMEWAQRRRSDTLDKFDRLVRRPLLQLLEPRVEEVERTLERLLILQPFYSVEAWTYQHTKVALSICERSCGEHGDQLRAWGADRGLLDEVSQPKKAIPCLSGAHNEELAGPGYPSDEVRAAGKSWTASVEAMAGSAALVLALRDTWNATESGN